MKYEFFPSNSNVFEYGMKGDKFYIVLDGNLEVWTPINFIKTFEDGTKEIYQNKKENLEEQREYVKLKK